MAIVITMAKKYPTNFARRALENNLERAQCIDSSFTYFVIRGRGTSLGGNSAVHFPKTPRLELVEDDDHLET